MRKIFYSTNNKRERANFEEALLRGMAPDFGLYMISRDDLPLICNYELRGMKNLSYAQIAFNVLRPILSKEIPDSELESLLEDAYDPEKIPTEVKNVTGRTNIMWLTKGPTYSFKDYAARFFARTLNHFLSKKDLMRTVVVATSGDTGGAVADSLYGLDSVDNIVFFPKGTISEGQRRQMTTLGGNVYAFEVNGDFDACQALAKTLLGDKEFAKTLFDDENRFTSANSISVGRLLPQAVYPFFAYSRAAEKGEYMIASIPSGNFGDMMGTVLAKEMGLPVSKIICGVNENTEFPDFLRTGEYVVSQSRNSPSSAMIVSHPSNLARLIDFYGGHMFDQRDRKTKKVTREGVMKKMPDMGAMRRDIFSRGIDNDRHYATMEHVYEQFGVILDPHGAVGWAALDDYLQGIHNQLAVIYETADPGKFPLDVKKAIGITPDLPEGMKRQASAKERIYSIISEPDHTEQGMKLSTAQVEEARYKIIEIFSGR
jgi:threonine synthase